MSLESSGIKILVEGTPLLTPTIPAVQSTPQTHPQDWRRAYGIVGQPAQGGAGVWYNIKEAEALRIKNLRESTSGSR